MRLWGRTNSVNVQKVLWCLAELGLEYQRIDAGMQYGVVDTAEYRARNPNGRVPTLEDGALVLWESHAILRHLGRREGSALYPPGNLAALADIDRWLDWAQSTIAPAERPLFWGLVRTRPEARNADEIAAAAAACASAWAILDAHLARSGAGYVAGERLSLADISLGCFARRWYGVTLATRPDLPALATWYARLEERPGFQAWVAGALS